MALEVFANRPTTTVSSGGTTAPAGGTSESWNVVSSASFPAASNTAAPPTLFHVADPNAPSELIAVTNVSGQTWTVTRGAENTTPVAHTAGFAVYQVVTAGGIGTFPQYYNVRDIAYGAMGDNSTDDTTAIQAALTAAAAAGGGTVFIPAGTYKVSNLTIGSRVTLQGESPATVLADKSGSSGYMIALTAPSTTYEVTIRDLTLNPATGSLGGIQLDNTGYTSAGGRPTSPLHELDNIYVNSAGGDAFHFGTNARALKVTRCRQDNAGGYGFYLDAGCTDSRFSDCTSGESVNHGWYVAGWVNNFANCRTSLAGWTGASPGTTGCGWEITGQYNTFTSCSAQQAALHGWDLNGSGGTGHGAYNVITGCEADTNNQGQTAGVGFNINAATYCTVIGNVGQNNGGTGTGQVYGIQVTGTQTGTCIYGNAVAGTSGPFNYVSGGGYQLISQATVDFSGVTTFKANISGQYLCTPSSYAPASQTALTTTSATFVAVSSASANTGSFIAPPSGSVVVGVSAVAQVSAATNLAFGLAAHGGAAPVSNALILREAGSGTPRAYQLTFPVTGLTAGTSYNLDLLYAVSGGNTVTVFAYGTSSTAPTGTNGGPVTMTVQAV